jgi:hypothetical protein
LDRVSQENAKKAKATVKKILWIIFIWFELEVVNTFDGLTLRNGESNSMSQDNECLGVKMVVLTRNCAAEGDYDFVKQVSLILTFLNQKPTNIQKN